MLLFKNCDGQVPLPAPTAGVPLPTQGQASLPPAVGPVIVPLSGGQNAPVVPYVTVGNSGGLKAVSDPVSDEGIQKLVHHPMVLQRLQLETKADSAVKISQLITAHKQVIYYLFL